MHYLVMKEKDMEETEETMQAEEMAVEEEIIEEGMIVTEEAVVEEVEETPTPAPAGVGRDAVEGILNQLKDSRELLAGASSPKVQKAVSKLTEAITWLTDALGSAPKVTKE